MDGIVLQAAAQNKTKLLGKSATCTPVSVTASLAAISGQPVGSVLRFPGSAAVLRIRVMQFVLSNYSLIVIGLAPD